ncbi:MAG: alpha/beta hydrolase [Xanthobacteraceae bacterium]
MAVSTAKAVRSVGLAGCCKSQIDLDQTGRCLAAGMNRKDPRVSPLYADLQGFPPTLIQVGSAEVLLADATRFAAMAGAADVAVTLEIWPHMIHAWPLWNTQLEPGRRALASAGAFIRRYAFL